MDNIRGPEIIVSWPDHEIPRSQSHPAPVCKQIGYGEFICNIRIVEPEFRNIINNPVVPVKLLFIYKYPQCCCSKCLAV